ncbi:kinase-like protein [Gonapodya prolifera JEL478]|uniref:Kinase-like protein n=1 Tax=Gonapodya prolifera (strain JEL478) TaxID=1344416 RepID=A0A139A177_GONPJ|nr:kinase-like protein [Gonapodya prolifera JEL478]|eukprot:KXS10484.1 kinase-like protein [Gonapodya prolifera JEL478]
MSSVAAASGRPRDRLEEFRLVGRLGEGTFSEVLRVKHRVTGKVSAMKRFRKTFKGWVVMGEVESLREIQALRRLAGHPNVIELEEVIFEPSSGVLALNFELMDCNLYELLSRKSHHITHTKTAEGSGGSSLLSDRKIKIYMYQVFRALEIMHGKGIFHRDVKPENILIHGPIAKIADFGSCHGVYSRPPFTEYIATRWYRSPECLLSSGLYSSPLDIWSAGCVLFELVARVPLFPGSNELDQLHRIHNVLGTPEPKVVKKLVGSGKGAVERGKLEFGKKERTGIRRLVPQASDVCVDLIARLLKYDPDER